MACENQSYKLGRGRLFLKRKGEADYRYIGNTPEFNLSINTETLDHYCSDGGLKEKDFSIELSTERTGNFVTDNIVPENVALFFFGEANALTTAATTGNTWTIASAKLGRAYKIGTSDTDAVGATGIDPATFQASVGGTALTVDVDYKLNADAGVIELLPTATGVADGNQVDVTYDVRANTRTRVISGTSATEGSLMYIERNPKGEDFTWVMPLVKVSPNGDYALKGDEFQQIPFNIEVLKPSGQEAIYMDGAPTYS
jgi:hypothetical protein